MKYKLDSEGFHIGSKTYVGECLDFDLFDIGRTKYNGKVYHYSHGKYQVVKASQPIFRVPVPGLVSPPYREIHTSSEEPQKLPPRDDRDDNLRRAHKRIQQIILLNSWKYFLTITFNDGKINASDNVLVLTKLQRWLKNRTYRSNLAYLLVPEYHKRDKRIHAHALVSGDLNMVESGTYGVQGFKKPVKLDTIRRYHIPDEHIKYPVYNCADWKYGFSTAIPVYGSPSRLANYVQKYITKDTELIFGKSYWCSKNLKLYPDTELYTLPDYDYVDTVAKEYYHRGAQASFKYINRLGDSFDEDSDDEVVLESL